MVSVTHILATLPTSGIPTCLVGTLDLLNPESDPARFTPDDFYRDDPLGHFINPRADLDSICGDGLPSEDVLLTLMPTVVRGLLPT